MAEIITKQELVTALENTRDAMEYGNCGYSVVELLIEKIKSL